MIRTELTRRGFTIVELLIVVVVIAILASLALVSFNGITNQADEASLRSDLKNAITKLSIHKVQNDIYPDNLELAGINDGNNSEFTYSKFSDNSFCLSARSKIDQTKVFFVDENGEVNPGSCEPAWTDIAAGNNHTCGILSGKAYCWGTNAATGVLGTGATSGSALTPQPVDTSIMSGRVDKIVAYSEHTCAISQGKAYCWGTSWQGELGNGTVEGVFYTPQAVDDSIMSGAVTDISISSYHACAVADKKAYCWGRGIVGELGNNSLTSSTTPTPVDTSIMAVDVVDISTGNQSSCAVTVDGLAYCWGRSGWEIGAGGSTSAVCGGNQCVKPTPVVTTGVDLPFTSATAGSWHSCGIASDKAYCWGRNSDQYGYLYGHLGDGSGLNVYYPVSVSTSTMTGLVTSIKIRSSATCAIASAKAYCWGNGASGILGNGSSDTQTTPHPVNTSVMSGAVGSIDVGMSHACATSDGEAYCWGSNGGRLGNGLTTHSYYPVAVIKPTL